MPPLRPPAVAGRFYPGDAAACRRAIERFPKCDSAAALVGIVPHAGWSYSGPVAWRTISSVARGGPETIVIFGAVHVMDRNVASLFPSGTWLTPLGPVAIDVELAQQFAAVPGVSIDAGAHAHEHSIEVELPLIQTLCPTARIVPLMVRPTQQAMEIGRRCAEAAAESGRRVAFLASTDLTHYGPWFGFEPAGHGPAGLRWAKEVNDRRFVHLVETLDIPGVVPEAALHRNACGAGAVAAALAAAEVLGATAFSELEHTSSADVEGGGERENSVGYLAAVLGPPREAAGRGRAAGAV